MKYAVQGDVIYCIHGAYLFDTRITHASFATRAGSIKVCGGVFHGDVHRVTAWLTKIKRDRTGVRPYLPLGPLR